MRNKYDGDSMSRAWYGAAAAAAAGTYDFRESIDRNGRRCTDASSNRDNGSYVAAQVLMGGSVGEWSVGIIMDVCWLTKATRCYS